MEEIHSSITAFPVRLFIPISGFAQNPELQFAAVEGYPSGNEPVTSTALRLRNNTNNLFGTSFATSNPAFASSEILKPQLTNQKCIFCKLSYSFTPVYSWRFPARKKV